MKFLLYQLLFFPSCLFAQAAIKGVVLDGNRHVLPFTNIVSLNRNIGTITNDQGQFSLENIANDDSVKISNIAYYSKVLTVKELKENDTIMLTENVRQLDEIILQNLSKYKTETELGFYNYISHGEFKLMPGNQLAIFIENKQGKEGWIKGISFKVKEFGKCKNSMRIRILKMDSVKFMPSADILDENAIIKSSELKKANYIDLSNYKIILPKEGVFIILEWLYPDKDCDKNSYTSIASNLLEPSNIVWLNFRDKAWSKGNRPRLPNGNYNTPNIGLRVAY